MAEDRVTAAEAAAGDGLGTVGERRMRLPSRRSAAIAIASPELPSPLSRTGLVFSPCQIHSHLVSLSPVYRTVL